MPAPPAERAADRLQDLLPKQVTVLRDGKTQIVDAVELVRGDLVLLAAGDRVCADLTLVPDRWSVGVFARYQDVDGNNMVSLLPGYSTSIYSSSTLRGCTTTAPGTPCEIPEFDDTQFTNLTAWVRYQFAAHWTAMAGVGFEDYTVDDAQTENALNYMPASFFLQANNRDYKAWVGFLGVTYSNQ